MALADRLAVSTTLAVLGTAVLVGGSAAAWIDHVDGSRPQGLVVVEVLATLIAMGLAHAVIRASAIPAIRPA